MPQLPISQITARSTLVNAPVGQNTAGPDAYGAGIARAQSNLAAAAGAAGNVAFDAAQEEAARKRKEDIANTDAKTSTDWLAEEHKLRSEVDADATDYPQLAAERYRQVIDTNADGIADDKTRMEYRQQQLEKLPSIINRAGEYQDVVQKQRAKDNANASLGYVQNNILQDPTNFDQYNTQANNIIDALPNVPANIKAGMKLQSGYDNANKRFEGLLLTAKTPQDYATLEAELRGKGDRDWKALMLPRDYEDTFNKINAAKKIQQTKIESQVKGALKTLEDRDADPQNLIPQDEMTKTADMVAQTSDAESINRFHRIARNQEIVKSEGKLTPEQLRLNIERAKQTEATPTPLPPDLVTIADKAANDYGLSPSFLHVVAGTEFGGELAKKNPDYAKKNPLEGSTSTGLLQFNDATWWGTKDKPGLLRDPDVAAALGVDTSKMSDAEVLALRADPKLQLIAGAILGKRNKAYMEPILGRPVTDAELYGAHFLGAPEAVRFIKATQANPEAIAADLFPAAATANANVFQNKKGDKLTLEQVYDNLARPFTGAVSRMAYDDNQVRQKMLNKMETELSGPDALKYAAGVGVIPPLIPLDQPGGFTSRPYMVKTASEYYGRRIDPFTTDELAYANKIVEEGNVDASLKLMADVQSMGPQTAQAAFSQLKFKNPAFAHAGLLATQGDPAVAQEIVRGAKRMKENPSLLSGLDFGDGSKASVDFESAIGGSLAQLPAQDREGVKQAALAYLVETKGAAGKEYNSTDYKAAVNTVMGGRIGEVNGYKTFLPKGMTSLDMQRMLERMDLWDYVSMSTVAITPKYADGHILDPKDVEHELKLQAIGDNKYRLKNSDDNYFLTGRLTPEGLPERYVIEITPERARQIIERQNRIPSRIYNRTEAATGNIQR